MKRPYFRLQCKRAFRQLPLMLAISLLLFGCLAVVWHTMVILDTQSEDQQKVRIGVVGDASASYLGFGIEAIQTLDITRFSVSLEQMTEEQAQSLMRDGVLAAYVVIPEGFIDDVVHGTVPPLRYVTTDGAVGITTLFKEEMLKTISRVLVQSQNGLYGMQDAVRANGLPLSAAVTDKLTTNYFSLILSRSHAYDLQTLGISDALSFSGYLLCGICILWLALGGAPYCGVFVVSDTALSEVLCASGFRARRQILSEYAAYALCILLQTMAAALLFAAVNAFSGGTLISSLAEKAAFSASGLFFLFLRLIPIVLAISAMQFFFFSLSTNLANGILLQFLSAVCLSYVSGCMYPIEFFPKAIQIAASLLPTGLARQSLCAALSAQSDPLSSLGLLIYTAILLLLSAFVRRVRLARR
ncbi:MAG: ABC transporter permease [Clostridia bacterium]|nr:ABC transporter permease [Clostridia bacterium]